MQDNSKPCSFQDHTYTLQTSCRNTSELGWVGEDVLYQSTAGESSVCSLCV